MVKKEEELKAGLEKHEAEQAAELREKFRAFNIDEFVADVDQVLEVEVPELKAVVKYKRLTNADLVNASKIKDEQERGLEILFYMLSKADAKVTREKVHALDPVATTHILLAITGKTPVFLT